MSALDQLINIVISQQTAAVPTPSFSIPAIFGPSARFAAVSPAPTGNTSNGSNTITSVSSMTGISPGCYISGAGIPTGTFIKSLGPSSIVLSANATATATGVTLTIKDAIRGYTSTAGMLNDGFQTTDPEYIRAVELLSQAQVPALFYVGSYSASVAQVDTITVNTATNGHTYTGKVQGQTWSYTATGIDTTSTIATAIASAINALSNPTWTAAAVAAVVTITSNTPGLGFTDTQVTVDATYTIANSTPNHTIVTDIQQAQVENDSWYGLMICSNTDGDITQVAAYIETLIKIFMAVANDGNIPTSSTTDLASTLKALAYKRTALVFSIAAISQGIEAAWMGGQLPATPGSNNWAFKTLVGISPDTLSASAQAILIGVPEAQIAGKNVNIYQTVGGVNITEMGQMIGGQYIDITIGIDWFKATCQVNLYTALIQASKIPYTDNGVAILIAAVQATIRQGVANGLIDGNSPISVTAPSVLSVPASQRANRVAPTISFSFRLAGAINAVNVSGIVTV